MGGWYRPPRFSLSRSRKGNIRDLRPGQRSRIRVKSEQSPPPFKRYGSLPAAIPWPDPQGPRRVLGENWREQLDSLNQIGKEQPGPEYRQTEREARRAAKRKTGPGRIAKALKTAVQLPGLPDGSPPDKGPFKPTKLRSGPPRGVGILGFAVELFKDRERICEEASRGQFSLYFDKCVFKSWLATQPPGTTIPGDLPVAGVLGSYISDVDSEERIGKGNTISNKEFAWRKDQDGMWHLIPAPASQPRPYQTYTPEKLWPKWQKGQDGQWHLIQGQSRRKAAPRVTPPPQHMVQKPPAFKGSRATASASYSIGGGIGGPQSGMPKTALGHKFPGSISGFGPRTAFSRTKHQTSWLENQTKPNTIFDQPSYGGVGKNRPGGIGKRRGGHVQPGTGMDTIVRGIQNRYRPRPVGGRLPTPGFQDSASGPRSGFHTVKRGEVLSRIANQYGSSVNAFARDNPWLQNRQGRILRGVDYIRPGDRLRIPGHNR